MPWQFRVIEGADQGKLEGLPDVGVTPIGSSRRHAEFHLNDLYVARVHGEVETNGPRIVLTAHDSPAGTMVNGQKITQPQELKHGDVVRMGNSHIRVEDCDLAAKEAPPPEEDVPELDIEVVEEAGGAEEEEIVIDPVDEGAPAPADVVEAEVIDDVDDVDEVVEATAVDAAEVSAAATAVQAQPLPSERLKELVGHDLAHFQVEDVIAMGRTSVVFQAHDMKKDQLVALKVLAPDFPHTEAEMKRYVAVWKEVMALRHPNLVSLYGVGKTGPFCWLSTEFVEAAPLPEIIERLAERERIDWTRGYRVALQIGRALRFAHERGIVHGNITASHILWRKSDKVAKLADLGLASALEGSNLRKITIRDKIQTDLVYFAPEQTEPENFIDGVCDIYSLGVVVYALLTGRFPYAGGSQAETIRKIREGQLTRPQKLQPEIPKRLDAIVAKMLARSQEDRYQTANEMIGDLEAVGEEQNVPV